jgi:hypothetical protein
MTGMTTWERWKASLAPRDKGERARFRELDASAGKPPPRPRSAIGTALPVNVAGWLERSRTARASARIPAERIEEYRDHAAGHGLDTLRDHYDALLEDRDRRESRKGGAS